MRRALLFCLFLLSNALSGQNDQYTISGYIRDASNGEELIGVNVVITELRTGSTTNNYGYYSISLPPGKYTISIQYIGYETIEREITLSQDLKLNWELKENWSECK